MKLYKDCKVKRKIIHWGKIEKKRNLKEKKILKKHQIYTFLLARIENNNINNINIDTKLRSIECILNLINIYEIIFIMLYVCKTILLTYRMLFKLKQKYFQL